MQMINNFNTLLFAGIIKFVLFMLFIICPHSAVAMELKRDVTQEQIDKYLALAIAYIEETKGWKPEEYKINYRITLADAPLALVQAIRYDAMGTLKKLDALGRHPTGEISVYIHTEEMRAFSDFEEFHKIRLEAEKKKAN